MAVKTCLKTKVKLSNAPPLTYVTTHKYIILLLFFYVMIPIKSIITYYVFTTSYTIINSLRFSVLLLSLFF